MNRLGLLPHRRLEHFGGLHAGVDAGCQRSFTVIDNKIINDGNFKTGASLSRHLVS